MERHLRIPGLIDLIITRDPARIRALADLPLLDRSRGPGGPLLNRLLAGRMRQALRTRRAPLPSARPRDDATRQEIQAALIQRLKPGAWDDATLDAMAAYVRGDTGRPAGELAQEAIGRAFAPDYAADAETWHAARVIDDHLRSWNPVLRLARMLAGALEAAQSVLDRAAGGDPAAVHGTGIAAPNLAQSLQRMRADWADARRRAALTPETAARRALVAPETVLRAATGAGDSVAGPLRPATLVALGTRDAAERTLDPALAFLSDSWSRCPAEAWVTALLAAIWQRAAEPAA